VGGQRWLPRHSVTLTIELPYKSAHRFYKCRVATRLPRNAPPATPRRARLGCQNGVWDRLPGLCATFGFQVVPNVMPGDMPVPKMVPRGAEKCPNALKLVAAGIKSHHTGCGFGGLVGKYRAAILGCLGIATLASTPLCFCPNFVVESAGSITPKKKTLRDLVEEYIAVILHLPLKNMGIPPTTGVAASRTFPQKCSTRARTPAVTCAGAGGCPQNCNTCARASAFTGVDAGGCPRKCIPCARTPTVTRASAGGRPQKCNTCAHTGHHVC